MDSLLCCFEAKYNCTLTASLEVPPCVRVPLKQSKCDQFGKGVDVHVGSTGDELCPVTAQLAYITKRGTDPGPLFFLEPGISLTKAAFVTSVRKDYMKLV